jgi:hypothetical protein
MQSLFKRLNKIGFMASVCGVIVVLMVSSSCKKKDRLSSSTFQFSITPTASTVVKTETLTLNARGNGDINPTWTVSSSTLGSVAPEIGNQVVFTPSALGDVVIYATQDGLQANCQVAIVTYKPAPNTFDVYNDKGLPTGTGINSDIFTSLGLSIAEISSGYTPEGVKYQRTTNAGSGDNWGVTLDAATAGLNKDLSAFSTGHLKFALRLARVVDTPGGETIRIELTDSAPATFGYNLVNGSDGFNRQNLDWQEISISLPVQFAGLDYSHVKVPFAVTLLAMTSSLTFDVDAVRWER